MTRCNQTSEERREAARCLRNAHRNIALAYAQINGILVGPGRDDRMLRETLDAVDWIRRALEHMEKSRVAGADPLPGELP